MEDTFQSVGEVSGGGEFSVTRTSEGKKMAVSKEKPIQVLANLTREQRKQVRHLAADWDVAIAEAAGRLVASGLELASARFVHEAEERGDDSEVG